MFTENVYLEMWTSINAFTNIVVASSESSSSLMFPFSPQMHACQILKCQELNTEEWLVSILNSERRWVKLNNVSISEENLKIDVTHLYWLWLMLTWFQILHTNTETHTIIAQLIRLERPDARTRKHPLKVSFLNWTRKLIDVVRVNVIFQVTCDPI